MNLVRALRNKVSGDKKRYNTGIFDLDLTYITDRIIAMAFPASGLEATYRNDINEVSDMLLSEHNGNFRIYNLTERLYDYTKFQWRVATVGWPDHHPPPLCLLFKIVEDMHNWLMEHPKNVVVVHCLAGKGRTGTVIGSYLLFSGLFNRLEDAERYFAIRRSVNNWGVTGPSQQRYTEFFWKILSTKQRPNPRPLRVRSITFLGNLKLSAGGKRGFSPVVTISDSTTPLQPRQLWQTRPDQIKTMLADKDYSLTIDLDPICVIQGDVNVTIEHAGSFGAKQKIGRFDFNSAMIGDDFCLNLTKNDIDDANNDKRVPSDFSMILLFEPMDSSAFNREAGPAPPLETEEFWQRIFSVKNADNGTTCFWNNAELTTNITNARALANSRMGVSVERGGYLTKQGHKVKNWKRRWFVLHQDSVQYYEKPKDVTARGSIKLDDVQTVQQLDKDECELPNSFVIITNWDDYICSADNEADMEGWIEDLLLALHIRDLKKQGIEYDPNQSTSTGAIIASETTEAGANSSPTTEVYRNAFSGVAAAAAAAAGRRPEDAILGQLVVQPLSVENWIIPGKVDGYATIQFGPQKYKATFLPNSCDFVFKDVSFDITRRTKLDQLIIQFWEAHSLFPDEIIGEVRINLDAVSDLMDRDGPVRIEEVYSFRKRSAQLADLKLALTFKPSAMVLAERASKTAEVRQTVEQIRRAEQLGQDGSAALNRLTASRRGIRESGGNTPERTTPVGSWYGAPEPLATPSPAVRATTPPAPASSSSGNHYGYDPALIAAATASSTSAPLSSSSSSNPVSIPAPAAPTPVSSSGNNYGYDPALIAAMLAKNNPQQQQLQQQPVQLSSSPIIVSANTGAFIPAQDPSAPPT